MSVTNERIENVLARAWAESIQARKIAWLYSFSGSLTVEQIAERSGLTIGTVKRKMKQMHTAGIVSNTLKADGREMWRWNPNL